MFRIIPAPEVSKEIRDLIEQKAVVQAELDKVLAEKRDAADAVTAINEHRQIIMRETEHLVRVAHDDVCRAKSELEAIRLDVASAIAEKQQAVHQLEGVIGAIKGLEEYRIELLESCDLEYNKVDEKILENNRLTDIILEKNKEVQSLLSTIDRLKNEILLLKETGLKIKEAQVAEDKRLAKRAHDLLIYARRIRLMWPQVFPDKPLNLSDI